VLAGYGNDDGAGVRGSGSASASGAGSGSGTGSGSGLAGQDLSGTSDDPEVGKAVADYKTWVVAEVDGLVADTSRFTDAVRAGNLAEAKRQYAPSRVRWERIEPIAGLVEEDRYSHTDLWDLDANADGSFDPYSALKAAHKTGMQAQLADLSEKLARIPGVLGLKG
jgi:iron uptake system EfeUOB component EfeO/EfeM